MKVGICDVKKPSFKTRLIDSVENSGFAVLINHGISDRLIRDAQIDWKQFFLNSQPHKDSFINQRDPNMGYKGFKSEKAMGAEHADLKQFFHWKPLEEIPQETHVSSLFLFQMLQDIGIDILKILDSNMYSDHGFSDACVDSENTILRTLYYPAMDYAAEPGSVRAAEHEDINFITLLVAASAPGLEVKDKDGSWHAVPHQENSIILNIGDMLQLASGGQYKSTTHRVVNADDSLSDRISMPLFMHPRSKTVLAPGITAQQFLDQRLAEIYQKP